MKVDWMTDKKVRGGDREGGWHFRQDPLLKQGDDE